MTKRRQRWTFLTVLAILGLASAALVEGVNRWRLSASGGDGIFEIKPYLQLGDAPTPDPDGTESLVLIWQTVDRAAEWSVAVRDEAGGEWRTTAAPTFRRIEVDGLAPFLIFRAPMTGLKPGETFSYQVSRAGTPVFQASARSRKPPGRSHRFVAIGDCGAGTWEERRIAYQAALAKPDYVIITGDIVYYRGRVSEYLTNFFPVYNSDTASNSRGAPLARSALFLAAPGNHDLIEGDFDRIPDTFAYFYYWDVPRNGPLTSPEAAGAPLLKGDERRRRAFLKAAPTFPQPANYSFDYGDVHWVVLDSNPYIDWTDPKLIDWLKADLHAAHNAAWRFVTFHHPGFNSSKAHADDQRMRVLAPVLEAANVQVVFNGHVHNYQRTYPLRFQPNPPSQGAPYGPGGRVEGRWTLDKAYDGSIRTRPDGIIYLITGAGGARLYDSSQEDDPAARLPFTARFLSKMHSMTLVDVTPGEVTIRQVSADGAELDRFVLTH
jgi:hypothetical protein